MSDLLFDVSDGVALLTLNRPARKNAFTPDLIDEWAARLREAASMPDVGAIVVTGAGDAFCSGIDIAALEAVEPTALARKHLIGVTVHKVALALADIDLPVLAAINGDAVGAGLDMALMCDIRFCARSARLCEAYVRLGLVPGDGGAFYLTRLVGRAKALELLLTGDFVSSEDAVRWGMVNRVYEDDAVLGETLDLARRLARGPRVAQGMIKRSVYQSEHLDVRTALDMISSHMAIAMSTADAAEALLARQERREPVFRGR
jgi:enoyl-CoA hydratase/carnithine racemase